eukprot:m.63579 g.63579  ORF g.63579 m.63579 type:complete len:582 (-) comp16366_c1_seq1:46-1791(-)
MAEKLQLLPGESILQEDKEATLVPQSGPPDPGTLIVTNFRLFFAGKQAPLVVPLCSIEKVDKAGGQSSRGEHSYATEIFCKDLRTFKISHKPEGHSRRQVYEVLAQHAFPYSNGKKPFAFTYHSSHPQPPSGRGWKIFDSAEEFQRQGTSEELWRLTSINQNYQVCSTYPQRFAVPTSIDDNKVRAVANFRSRGRIPVLSWYNRKNTATITRCSQPKVGIAGKRSQDDEDMIRAIREANSTQSSSLSIYDARPRRNALANQAKGLGFESDSNYPGIKIMFLDIHNIHVMRDSLKRLRDMCASLDDDGHWYMQLHKTEWLKHAKTILTGANTIATEVASGNSVLIHCSDGWDRTAQLSGLSMLILDPYYRTMTGFAVLIEKEWLSFGHKFAQRVGHGDSKHGDDQRSPVFLQFIDCVWQITQQFPCAFEFNERFLVDILDHLYSCQFGTFLFNSDRERSQEKLHETTVSLWDHIFASKAEYENPLYVADRHDVLKVLPSMRFLALWSGYFLRWHKNAGPEESVIKRTQELQDLCTVLQEQCRELESKQQESDRQIRQERLENRVNVAPAPASATRSEDSEFV